jgi:D-sedoheptulose 7-phosphate isomerase
MPEGTDFLYPFIEGDERDPAALLADLARSAAEKEAVSVRLLAEMQVVNEPVIDAASEALARSFERGGRLFTFGNGGSSTDAAAVASLFSRPPWGESLAARCLVDDTAVLTALANDVGFELVFSRQLIAHARAGDMTLGLSTSGGSRNVLTAFAEARARGVGTIGFAGYDGGAMAASADVEHCVVVRSDSVHRVQEVQAALAFALWSSVQSSVQTRVAEHRPCAASTRKPGCSIASRRSVGDVPGSPTTSSRWPTAPAARPRPR